MYGNIDAAFYETNGNDGLFPFQIRDLIDRLTPSDNGYIPVQIPAADHECCAMGFITTNLEEACDFNVENSYFGRKVQAILDDMNLETFDGLYTVSIGDTDYLISIERP